MLRLPPCLVLILTAVIAVSAGKDDDIEKLQNEIEGLTGWRQFLMTLCEPATEEKVGDCLRGEEILSADEKFRKLEKEIQEKRDKIQEELKNLEADLKKHQGKFNSECRGALRQSSKKPSEGKLKVSDGKRKECLKLKQETTKLRREKTKKKLKEKLLEKLQEKTRAPSDLDAIASAAHALLALSTSQTQANDHLKPSTGSSKSNEEKLKELEAERQALQNKYENEYKPDPKASYNVKMEVLLKFFTECSDVNKKILLLLSKVEPVPGELDAEMLKKLEEKFHKKAEDYKNLCQGKSEKAATAIKAFQIALETSNKEALKQWVPWRKGCLDLEMEVGELKLKIKRGGFATEGAKVPLKRKATASTAHTALVSSISQIQAKKLKRSAALSQRNQERLKKLKAEQQELLMKYEKEYKPDPEPGSSYSVKMTDVVKFFDKYSDVTKKILLLLPKEQVQEELDAEKLKKLEEKFHKKVEDYKNVCSGESEKGKTAIQAFTMLTEALNKATKELDTEAMKKWVEWRKDCLDLELEVGELYDRMRRGGLATEGVKVHATVVPGARQTQKKGFKQATGSGDEIQVKRRM